MMTSGVDSEVARGEKVAEGVDVSSERGNIYKAGGETGRKDRALDIASVNARIFWHR